MELYDDGWAIRALPPGRRDLGCADVWRRSLARSRRRRDAAATRRTGSYKSKRALVSAALLTATVLAPANEAARAQGTEAAGTAAGDLLRMQVDGVVGPQTLGALGISGAAAPGAPAGAGAGAAVAAARSKVGLSYALGGVGPSAFDCSGLTQWAMGQAGIALPRTSFQQAGVGIHVDRAAIQAGDLVFFDANGPGASHVGIATSATTAISATTHGVREHATTGDYWGSHYLGARRVG